MNRHPEIAALAGHLQTNMRALQGRAGVAPRFSSALLIPVAAIVGTALLFSLSPKARKSLLLRIAMLVSTQLLQDQGEHFEHEGGSAP